VDAFLHDVQDLLLPEAALKACLGEQPAATHPSEAHGKA
jgi:hypothetical protein